MSETPFRVVPCPGWPDIRNVVAPNGTKFADGLAPIGAKAVADNLNAAWTAANGPELTRQRDEAVALLREADAWLSLCAHRLASETPKVGEPSRADILAVCAKIAAALRRGEVPNAK